MWTSIAIVFCAILFLVDKNKKWNAFWKVCRFIALMVVFLGVFAYWQSKKEQAAFLKHAADVTAARRECITGDAFDRAACVQERTSQH